MARHAARPVLPVPVALPRTLILGGGFAGLSAAIELSRSQLTEVTLVDAEASFLNRIQLHRSVYGPLDSLQLPYAKLAARFGFAFRQSSFDFTRALLLQWQAEGSAPVDGGRADFDYLALCSGARSLPIEKDSDPALLGRSVFTLESIQTAGLFAAFERALALPESERSITVIGGGATAIQFLFELHDCLRGRGQRAHLRLLCQEAEPLQKFPEAFARYARAALLRTGIEFLPQSRFLSAGASSVRFEHLPTGEIREAPSALTLLFPGVAPRPQTLRTDSHGRLLGAAGELHDAIYAAGDCSVFEGGGSNAMTAQTAVRKGRLIADNIVRSIRRQPLARYGYQELGYFVSLGMFDGIGWIFTPMNVLSGLPAFFVKEMIETQFALLLRGWDTYIL